MFIFQCLNESLSGTAVCAVVGLPAEPVSNIAELSETTALIMRDIYFFGSFSSLLFLVIALSIFCSFR